MDKPGVYRVIDPAPGTALPVLVDSPHSGQIYPPDFQYVCARQSMEWYEDRHVDQLVAPFAQAGATVIMAEVTRCYIDLNRRYDDFSALDLCDAWDGPFPPTPSGHTERGTGLIWTEARGQRIYDIPPSAAEVQARIDTYYTPYYQLLEDRAALLKARFGRFYHLNFHSMPTDTRADIVLGDLDGTSCSRRFRDLVGLAFGQAGLRVVANYPYKGARLTELFGWPNRSSESLQVEINKKLYLKPNLRDIDPVKFARLRQVLDDVLARVGEFALGETHAPRERAPARRAASTVDAVL